MIEPAWAFGWELGPSDHADFVTVVSLDEPVDPGGVSMPSGTDRAEVAFSIGGERVALAVDLSADPPVTRR